MRTALAIASLSLLAACGYRFTAGGAPLPDGVRQVHVPVFSNRTSEPGLEVLFTQSFREQVIRAGVLGPAGAEARIEGELRGLAGAPTILTTPLTPTEPAKLASYRVFATVSLRLTKGGKVLREVEVSGQEDYLPDRSVADPSQPEGDVLRTETNRLAAVRRLAELLARDGYERLTIGW